MKHRNLLLGICAIVWWVAPPAIAQTDTNATAKGGVDATSAEALEKRNRDLEKRVEQLERNQLNSDVETYLENVPSFTEAQGDPSLTPGSQALRISGEVRFRGEIRDHLYNALDPNAEDSFGVVLQRARLRFDLDVVENIEVTVQIQDVRAWGQEQATVGYLGNVDLKRAFVLFKNLGEKPIDLQVGRQVLFYGDQRLVGHLEWVDQGRTYDGIRLKAHPEKFFLDAWAVNIRETLTNNNDRYFYGIYGGPKFLDLYILGVQDQRSNAGETGSGTTFFATFGFRFHGKKANFDYSVEIPFQLGELNGDDLQAWAASATIGYTFEESRWQPRIYFEFNYASGDDDPTDGKVKQFQTLFPTNHLWYGQADQVGWNNLMEFRIGVLLKPNPRWRVRLDYHHMRRPEELGAWQGAAGPVTRPGAAGASSHLADEVDLIITWLPAKPVNIEFGWTTFFPGGFIEDTGSSPTATFAWLQCRVVF